MTTRTTRTDRAREIFLKEMRETCNVSHSARTSGVGRRTVYDWRDAEPDFAAAWDDAEQEAMDHLEKVARDRAIDGSDRMLEILLKAHRPEKFTDRLKNEHTGKDGAAIQIEQVNVDADAFSRRIARLAARDGAGSGAGET